MGIVPPHGPAELQGDEAHLLAVPGPRVELGHDHLFEPLERRSGSFEDAQAADVHGVVGPLDVQERRIRRAHPVHDRSSSSRISPSTWYTARLTAMPQSLEPTSTSPSPR